MTLEPFWSEPPGEHRQKLKTRYYEYHDARDASAWLKRRCTEWAIPLPAIVEARYSEDRIVLRRGDGRTETIPSDCPANVLRIILEHRRRVPIVSAGDIINNMENENEK